MADPIWLADVLRAEGLTVNIYPGAFDRGHGDMGNIWGVICHHTGSFGETPRGIAEHPSLGLASQLHLDRNGVYTLCGVGIAWHAGNGSWPGLPANNANPITIGIEAANDGGGTPGKPHRASWSDAQYDAYVRGVAAILRKLGRDSSHAIGHKEWAGASQGKWDPGALDMGIFRRDVQAVLDRKPNTPGGIMGSSEVKAVQDFVAGFCGPIGVDVKDVREQLAGSGARNTEDGFPGWPQLGGRTAIDALAAIGAALNISGFKDPKAGK